MKAHELLSVKISVDPTETPISPKYASIEIINESDQDLVLLSQLKIGAYAFIDIEVFDSKNTRISKKFQYAAPATPFFPSPQVAATIASKRSLKLPITLFGGIAPGELTEGRYTCRVHFAHGDLKASSAQIEVEVKKSDLDQSK